MIGLRYVESVNSLLQTPSRRNGWPARVRRDWHQARTHNIRRISAGQTRIDQKERVSAEYENECLSGDYTRGSSTLEIRPLM
ncbi:hypothetical protein BN903_72 [Halorubrum sp. AJ67]|nr:hypothetical protein BN903_72 [Halorubrum sp. AJ67]